VANLAMILHKLRPVLLLTALLNFGALNLPADVPAQTVDSPSEYDVKAAFLFNFGKFVEWPQDSPQARDANFTIGILGEDPFGPRLEQALAGKTIKGKPVVLEHLKTPAEAAHCSLVYVNEKEGVPSEVVNSLDHGAVLTVGDSPDFIDQGGIIAFRIVSGRVRFDVNLKAAEQANLKISSDLLKVAKRVRGV
jgi:hypothetical protein